jgi:hypothetical protein
MQRTVPRAPTLALAYLVAALALAAGPARAAAQGFVVVAHAAGPAALSKRDAGRAFLKKGSPLVAVDQERDSRTRDAFSRAVLGRPATSVVMYWQQQIFSGRDLPPVEKRSDADVLAFVRGNPRAIGYVAAGTELGAGVKVVTLR